MPSRVLSHAIHATRPIYAGLNLVLPNLLRQHMKDFAVAFAHQNLGHLYTIEHATVSQESAHTGAERRPIQGDGQAAIGPQHTLDDARRKTCDVGILKVEPFGHRLDYTTTCTIIG
jgi:hypothetical protein